MDACPNLYVDISARISELGRQPYSAKRFFHKHQDRILFGIDAGPDLDTYATYARFLESEDEYFSYAPDNQPGQGRWMIYGLHLPKDILDKVYHDNAARLFGLPIPQTPRKDLP
jgi:predicted TIM-barrel fold metal-dependent hydrolase